MANKVNKTKLEIENADIHFRNFEGKEGKFNPAGRRNFCVFLEDDIAKKLEKDGWNVKYLTPRDPEDKEQAYLQVAVSFDNYPPNIYLVSSTGKNRLTEDNVNILDFADLETVDIVVTPYKWEVNGKTGTKAYLKTLYAVLEESDLDRKYLDTPDSGENTIGGCGNCDACDGGCHADQSL